MSEIFCVQNLKASELCRDLTVHVIELSKKCIFKLARYTFLSENGRIVGNFFGGRVVTKYITLHCLINGGRNIRGVNNL